MKRKSPQRPPGKDQHHKAPPVKGASRLSRTRQSAVIAARFAGLSERKIEKVTGVSRHAIRRVLSQSEVRSMLDAYRDEYREIVPLALDLIRHDLSIRPKKGKHANPDSLKAAIEITKGAQVAVPRSQGEIEVRKDRFSEMTDEELEYFIATGKELNPKPIVKPGNA